MSPPAESGFDPGAETRGGISIKTVDIDHMSLVRYVHATALRMQSADELTEDEIERFCDGVYEPSYTVQLMAQDSNEPLPGLPFFFAQSTTQIREHQKLVGHASFPKAAAAQSPPPHSTRKRHCHDAS